MVSNLSLCVTVGLALCQPNTMSEEGITQQKHYSELENNDIEEIMEEALAPTTYTRSMTNLENILDTYEYVEGYYAYVEEQERIAEEQRRLQEEQRRLAEEERQRELEHIAWENRFDRKGYRQTYYGTFENEVSVGAGFSVYSPEIKSINGVYHFNDTQYGYVQVVAISLREVLNSGQNSRGIWNIYGSIIEMKYPNGEVKNAIVLDACSACDKADKIDLWVSTPNSNLDIMGVDWRYVRKGWSE